MEIMQRKRSQNQKVLLVLVAVLVFHQNLLFPAVMCRTFEDQKTYYRSPPHRGSHGRHHHRSSPPSHGGSGTPSPGGNCSPTPSDPKPPSHGGGSGSYHYSPPVSGGSPPLVPTPDVPTPIVPTPDVPTPIVPSPLVPTPDVPTPTDPTPPSSGGYQYPPPTSSGSPPDVPTPLVPTPTDPTPPSGGDQYPPPTSSGSPPDVPSPLVPTPTDPTPPSGGYQYSPPTSSGSPPLVPTPIDPTPPSSGGYQYPPPTSDGSPPLVPTPTDPTPPSGGGSDPVITNPPINPFDPGFQTPPTPLIPDPSSFPGTCDYWRNHPQAIWGIFGFGTLGGLFGGITSPSFSPDSSLLAALSDPRRDGIGALYREGTASMLNSMVNQRFPFTTDQVKQHFTRALISERAAATQAELFKQANEGRLKPRA